jgi:hypothetical protein
MNTETGQVYHGIEKIMEAVRRNEPLIYGDDEYELKEKAAALAENHGKPMQAFIDAHPNRALRREAAKQVQASQRSEKLAKSRKKRR